MTFLFSTKATCQLALKQEGWRGVSFRQLNENFDILLSFEKPRGDPVLDYKPSINLKKEEKKSEFLMEMCCVHDA